MDPDPAIFVIDLQDASKKTNFLTQFFSAFYFLKVHLHYFSKIKSQKESKNSRIQGFSYYFCMMIEGSGSGSRAGFGSGSGTLLASDPCLRPLIYYRSDWAGKSVALTAVVPVLI